MTHLVLIAALAGEPTWGLQWVAPPECRQAEALSAEVERSLKRPVFGASASMVVKGSVERENDEWRAKLTLVDERGTVLGSREVTSHEPACSALDKKVTLVITLLIDPNSLRPLVEAPALAPALPALKRVDTEPFDDRDLTQLTLVSSPPEVTLHEVRLTDHSARGSVVGTTVLCEGPCVARVKRGARLYLTGPGILSTPEFVVPLVPATTLTVQGGKLGIWTTGWALMTVGLVAVIFGVTGVIINTNHESALGPAAWVSGLAGLGSLIGGGVLCASARTQYAFSF